jgi:hypothetical protein
LTFLLSKHSLKNAVTPSLLPTKAVLVLITNIIRSPYSLNKMYNTCKKFMMSLPLIPSYPPSEVSELLRPSKLLPKPSREDLKKHLGRSLQSSPEIDCLRKMPPPLFPKRQQILLYVSPARGIRNLVVRQSKLSKTQK